MNMINEIEAMRKRILQEVNTEFDVLIERITKEGNASSEPPISPYEMKYPLTSCSGVFKGKKPTSVIINGEMISIRTWKQLVAEVMNHCISSDTYKRALKELAGKVSGKKRVLLANKPDGMRSALKICEKLYMETHYDTETLLNVLMGRILMPIGYDFSDIYVTVRSA